MKDVTQSEHKINPIEKERYIYIYMSLVTLMIDYITERRFVPEVKFTMCNLFDEDH